MVCVLGELGADVNAPTREGCTPVLFAAENGHCEAIRALSKLRANPNTPTYSGATPMLMAAQNGPKDVVKLLRKLGAGMAAQGIYGTVADLVSKVGHTDIAEKLTRYNSQCAGCKRKART